MKKLSTIFVLCTMLSLVFCMQAYAFEETVFVDSDVRVTIETDSFAENADGYSIEACFEKCDGSSRDIQTIVFDKNGNRCKITSARTTQGNGTSKVWNESELGDWKDIQPDSMNSRIKSCVFAKADAVAAEKAEEERREAEKKQKEEEEKKRREAEALRKKVFEDMISDPDNVTEKVRKFNKNLVYIDSGELPQILAVGMFMNGKDTKVFYYVDKKSIQSRKQNKMSYIIADEYVVIANSDTRLLEEFMRSVVDMATMGMSPLPKAENYLQLVKEGLFILPFSYSFNTKYPQMQEGKTPNPHKWQEIEPDTVDEEIYKYVKRHSGIAGKIGLSGTGIFAIIGILLVAFGGFVIYKRVC